MVTANVVPFTSRVEIGDRLMEISSAMGKLVRSGPDEVALYEISNAAHQILDFTGHRSELKRAVTALIEDCRKLGGVTSEQIALGVTLPSLEVAGQALHRFRAMVLPSAAPCSIEP
jgi:hypothetical protein